MLLLMLLKVWGMMGEKYFGQDKLEVGDAQGMGAEYHENSLGFELHLILGL